jgi:quercetin dioxygenase-like cupin family protein
VSFGDGSCRSYDADVVTHIAKPTVVAAAGNKPKIIEEFVGRVNSKSAQVSVARMKSPGGWIEPGQTPEFDEYTVVLRGLLRVSTANGAIDVHAGEAVIAHKGEWVQYSTPSNEGAEYVAICLPAFGPDIVHRDS